MANAVASVTLKYLSVPATVKHTATVIFVHGLGDTGHGWRPVADMFKEDPALAHVKWVLPHSPVRAVTANMGIVMPSWYDIFSFGLDTTEDEIGMKESSQLINELIEHEVDTSGIPPSRILLGGFSQGGTMSILSGLMSEQKLAGIAVLSGWLPLRDQFKDLASQNASSTPIFWGHGSEDLLVKLPMVNDSTKFLREELGVPHSTPDKFGGLTYKVYQDMGHTTIPTELEDLKNFIIEAIPALTE